LSKRKDTRQKKKKTTKKCENLFAAGVAAARGAVVHRCRNRFRAFLFADECAADAFGGARAAGTNAQQAKNDEKNLFLLFF